ncbi:hypothetical protein [Scytonema sp. PCC 10023]|uniref:hypothetical protein n=1 Tax=Scytonema sp. PCC 10023 TaxID=1680591 RepID=UPI0039C5F845
MTFARSPIVVKNYSRHLMWYGIQEAGCGVRIYTVLGLSSGRLAPSVPKGRSPVRAVKYSKAKPVAIRFGEPLAHPLS